MLFGRGAVDAHDRGAKAAFDLVRGPGKSLEPKAKRGQPAQEQVEQAQPAQYNGAPGSSAFDFDALKGQTLGGAREMVAAAHSQRLEEAKANAAAASEFLNTATDEADPQQVMAAQRAIQMFDSMGRTEAPRVGGVWKDSGPDAGRGIAHVGGKRFDMTGKGAPTIGGERTSRYGMHTSTHSFNAPIASAPQPSSQEVPQDTPAAPAAKPFDWDSRAFDDGGYGYKPKRSPTGESILKKQNAQTQVNRYGLFA